MTTEDSAEIGCRKETASERGTSRMLPRVTTSASYVASRVANTDIQKTPLYSGI
jgi:hypothetical protein